MPKVSCITIFLNEERFLADAIESVLAQTVTDWELLLVDDGSTDASPTIARAYAAAHPGKIHYLTHPGGANRGMSASRNLALRKARGERIGFLDGDDVWPAARLERQLALFAANPGVSMICGATLYWHSWSPQAEEADLLRYPGETPEGGGLALDRVYRAGETLAHFYPLGPGLTIGQSGYLIDREVALGLGGFEESFRGLFEDIVFLTKAFFECDVYISSECFDHYRQHPRSCMGQASRSQRDDAKLRYLEWLDGYLRTREVSDGWVRRRLGRLLIRYRYPRLHKGVAWLKRRVPRAQRSAAG